MATRLKDGTLKLDEESVEENLRGELESCGREHLYNKMRNLQVAVYVMAGGGFIGSSAACQPHDFYIDARSGRLPYKNRLVLQAVKVLELHLKVLGIDRGNIPAVPQFHNCGAF